MTEMTEAASTLLDLWDRAISSVLAQRVERCIRLLPLLPVPHRWATRPPAHFLGRQVGSTMAGRCLRRACTRRAALVVFSMSSSLRRRPQISTACLSMRLFLFFRHAHSYPHFFLLLMPQKVLRDTTLRQQLRSLLLIVAPLMMLRKTSCLGRKTDILMHSSDPLLRRSVVSTKVASHLATVHLRRCHHFILRGPDLTHSPEFPSQKLDFREPQCFPRISRLKAPLRKGSHLVFCCPELGHLEPVVIPAAHPTMMTSSFELLEVAVKRDRLPSDPTSSTVVASVVAVVLWRPQVIMGALLRVALF